MRKSVLLLGLVFASSPAFAQSSVSGVVERQVSNDMRYGNAKIENEYNSKVLLEKRFKEGGAAYSRAVAVAQCLATKAGTSAGGMLGGPLTKDPNYDTLAKALSNRKYNRCVGQEAAGIPINLVNAALAETMVKSENPSLDDRAKSVDVSKAEPFYTDAGGRTLDTVGRCLAVYSPGLAMRVLNSGAGTPGEKMALADLFAKSPECGVRQAPADFTVDEQRSVVAAGLYYWLHRG